MSKTYLAIVDYSAPVFINANSENMAFSMLAEYRHGRNDVFNLATKSMENMTQLITLYQTFYHEDIDVFIEVDNDKLFYRPHIDWIGDEKDE